MAQPDSEVGKQVWNFDPEVQKQESLQEKLEILSEKCVTDDAYKKRFVRHVLGNDWEPDLTYPKDQNRD